MTLPPLKRTTFAIFPIALAESLTDRLDEQDLTLIVSGNPDYGMAMAEIGTDEDVDSFKENELVPLAEKLGIGLAVCKASTELPIVDVNVSEDDLISMLMSRHAMMWDILMSNGTLDELEPMFSKMSANSLTLNDLMTMSSMQTGEGSTLH
jgi:hypothetical protein